MQEKTIKKNIKTTLFFSYSIIFSTLYGVLYLATMNECKSLQKDLNSQNKNINKYVDKIKSLNHKKLQLTQSIENTALESYNLIIPGPQPIIVFMDKK